MAASTARFADTPAFFAAYRRRRAGACLWAVVHHAGAGHSGRLPAARPVTAGSRQPISHTSAAQPFHAVDGISAASPPSHPTQTAGSGNHGERSLARHAENVSGPQGAARARVEHFTGRFWYRLLLPHLSEQAAAGQSQNRSQLCLRHADRPCAPCHRARSHHHGQLVWLQSHCGRCGKSRTVRLSFRHGLPLGTRFLFRTPHGGRGLYRWLQTREQTSQPQLAS